MDNRNDTGGNLAREHNGVFEVLPGSEINATIEEAVERSKLERRQIRFRFGFRDVVVTVEPDSEPELIRGEMWRAMSGEIESSVGPKPDPAPARAWANDPKLNQGS
jgi:hypothetical protein